jgi:hypothetical protein
MLILTLVYRVCGLTQRTYVLVCYVEPVVSFCLTTGLFPGKFPFLFGRLGVGGEVFFGDRWWLLEYDVESRLRIRFRMDILIIEWVHVTEVALVFSPFALFTSTSCSGKTESLFTPQPGTGRSVILLEASSQGAHQHVVRAAICRY